jgi:hypothetical protein
VALVCVHCSSTCTQRCWCTEYVLECARSLHVIAHRRLRYHGINLLRVLIRSWPKLFQQRWALYLSTTSSSSLSTDHHLGASLLHDSSARVRERVAACIATFLDGAKGFLSVATDKYEAPSRSCGRCMRALRTNAHWCQRDWQSQGHTELHPHVVSGSTNALSSYRHHLPRPRVRMRHWCASTVAQSMRRVTDMCCLIDAR